MACLFASTAPATVYPEYVSVNERPNDMIEITQRVPSPDGQACGPTGVILLNKALFKEMCEQSLLALDGKGPWGKS